MGVVAVGGGGIKTMSRRWEAVSDTYDQEKPHITESPRNARSIKDQARQAKDAAASQYGTAAVRRVRRALRRHLLLALPARRIRPLLPRERSERIVTPSPAL